MKQPDPKKHLQMSLIKSVFRIFAGLVLMSGQVYGAGMLLIVAEGIGVAEELV